VIIIYYLIEPYSMINYLVIIIDVTPNYDELLLIIQMNAIGLLIIVAYYYCYCCYYL